MESTTDLQHFFTDLQHFQLILRRRWRPATAVFGAVIGLAALMTFLQKPTYEANGKILLESSNSTSSLTESGKEIGELNSLAGRDPLDTQAEIIRSIPIVQRTIDALDLKDEQGNPLEPEGFIEKNLKVEKVRGTDILQVSYKSKVPQEATAVVNQLMSLYLENGILTDRAKAVVARNFIIRQLPKTEAIVRQAEAALRRFKEINNVADLDEEAKLAVEAVADFKKQVATTRTQLKNAEARSEALRNQLSMNPQEAVAVSSLSQSPAVQEVLEEFQQVEGELTVARTRYQEEHPIVADLRTKEAGLKALVQERTKQDLEDQKQKTDGKLQIRGLKQELISDFVNLNLEKIGLATQVAALSNEQLNNEQRIKVLPRLEQTQRQLERQVEAAQSTYQVLLQKLQETRIAENQNEGNARIVEYARVPKKFLLKPIVLKLALGGILGSLLFVATVFVLEVRDKSIKTVKEAREILGYTLLGIIPFLEKPEKIALRSEDPELSAPKLIVRDKPRSPISEAYRMLQSNLKFLNSDTELKTIVVTSCVAGEGKSSVSANLAVAIAQRGRRVLLIDGDMRRPIQHQIWELSNGMGLSDLIVGQVELKTVVKEVMDNLHVLTAGVMPPNPGALLDSKRMASLIKRFSDSYDFVIMDTPPLIAADDPRILGKMADGVVLVVRPGVVDSTSATSSKELLNQLDQNILGLVVNGVMPENEPHSYYYYAKEYYAEEDVKPTNVRV